MKKLLISFFVTIGMLAAEGQVIFSEDFDGVPGPTAGGAGTYSFPTGWFLRNVDNRTPAGNVGYVNEAWERREDFSFSVVDSCAFSTSWYSPAGAADDWMWTPAIAMPAGIGHRLQWKAVAYDPAFRDGYEVRIMTVAPTGGTGVIGNQVSNSTILFSTAAENSAWTERTVNLEAYAGQTVYIGFRNNSNDKFLLLIDDIVVERTNPLPVKLVSFNGKAGPNANELYWNVAEQSGIQHYELERSFDGTAFQKIGVVKASASTQATYSYSDDHKLPKPVYYRLKIVEQGTFEYSRIIKLEPAGTKGLSAWPNPATSVLTLQGDPGRLLPAQATISDAQGRNMQKLTINRIPFDVNISDLPAGIYFLQVNNQNPIRFVKQ